MKLLSLLNINISSFIVALFSKAQQLVGGANLIQHL